MASSTSSRISRLDQQQRLKQHYVPRMRPFIVLLLVSIVAFTILSGDRIRPTPLEQVAIGARRYYLMLEEHHLQYDQYHLYQCTSNGLICEIIFTELGSSEYTNIRLNDANGDIQVLVDGSLVFSLVGPSQ